MKKQLFTLLLLVSGLIVSGQSLQLLQLTDSLPVSQSYTFNIAANDPTFVYEIIVKNVSANSVATKVRRTIFSTVTGHDIYFCYGGTCYTPVTSVSTTVAIGAGQRLPNGSGSYGIRTEFDNNGVVGTSTVRYSAFDAANSNDTAVVYITYNVTTVGVESFSNNVSVSNAYPNPATNLVKISYNLNNAMNNASVKIYNALGSLVKSIPVNSAKSTTQIDVSDLEEGFYFYTLVSNGKTSSTRKFIVER